MRKLYTTLVTLLIVAAAMAQSYGILVNGKDYYPGTENPSPIDPQYQEFMALGLPLKAGDYCQLYDQLNAAAWVVPLDGASTSALTMSGDRYSCQTTGCYDFYIKLKYEADQLYVGSSAGDCQGNKPIDPSMPNKPDNQTYTTSAPAQYPGVMLQAFYWDSYKDQGYGRTKWIDLKNQAEEIGQWFDLVWLPPSSKSTGGTGYLPMQYATLDSDWGTRSNLLSLIEMLHENGARVVADMVVNHAVATSGWCTMAQEKFGTYGTFQPTMSWICSTDEAFTGGHCSETPGAADDGYGLEANYEAGRDWDHTNAEVRNMFKAYAQWLINTVGYDGFRYDYCKGFHNSHINDYNQSAKAYFSVMEMWDGNPDVLMSHLNDAGYNTTTFDFATKYEVFNNGIAADNYNLRGKGLLGRGKGRYAVTFVDSHDSFQRDDNEFCGKGNSMKYKDKLMQCNAYLLSMPGTPCVFYPHWVTFKDDLKKLINARYKTGVHNESAVSDESGSGYYKATITGTNGQIRLLLGPNSGYATTPDGFTLAAKGNNWGVYYKTNSPRGDKDKERQPIGQEQGLESVMSSQPQAEKVLINGQLLILVDGTYYNVMGHRVQ